MLLMMFSSLFPFCNGNSTETTETTTTTLFCFPPCFPLANLEKQKQQYQHVMHITTGSILKERKTIQYTLYGMYIGVLIHFFALCKRVS